MRARPRGATAALEQARLGSCAARAACAACATGAICLLGCGGHGRESAPIAAPRASADAPPARRQPDGVVVDPATEKLPVSDRAAVSTAFAALRAGPAPRGVRKVVDQYFSAIASEDLPALRVLATDDATVSKPKNKGIGSSLVEVWRSRFVRLDYHPLSHLQIYRDEDLGLYTYEDLTASSSEGRRPSRPATMEASDLLVLVPIISPRAGAERLLGDEIRLVLRRQRPDGLAIREMVEDFDLQ